MKRGISFVVLICCAMVAALSLAVSGCTSASAVSSFVAPGRPLRADADADAAGGLAAAIDDFGVDLLKVAASDDLGNVVVSPASVHAALSMTVNGATDETAKQMRTVLHTDSMTPAEANAQWAALLGALGKRSPEQKLEIANALWAQKSVAFKKPFIDADRDFFGAQLSTLDFGVDDVAGAINGWASKNTHGMITKMLDRVDPSAILFLANAVYFKGEWVLPFTRESTHKGPFTRADGSKVDVDMMNMSARLPYADNAALEATRLSYKGGDASFYILLPKPGVGLDAAMSSLGKNGFADLRRTMASKPETEVIVGLPKLDTEYFTSLRKPLADMGMPRAFDPAGAQFSGMADFGSVYIHDVLHKTKVKVDEKGTEVAAVTVVVMSRGAALVGSVEPPRIVCDRPYLFAIVDEGSGAMLFLGAVNDPTWQGAGQ